MAKKATLKSHFKIRMDTEEEEEALVAEEAGNVNIPPNETEVEEEQEEQGHREAVTGEEKPRPLLRVLQKSEVSIRLSCLGKVATGDGYTYLKAECTGMGLTDVRAIATFKHLQFVNVSDNILILSDLQVLTELPYLLLLHADRNLIRSAALKRTKFLQVIIMNNNDISSCHDIYQPQLSTLELGYNKITKVHFDNNMPEIKCLDFRYNMIQDLIDWNFPNLMCLYLAGNKIKRLDGIEKLVNLRILHLRNNPIKKINGFHENMIHLKYLNLRNCKVSTLRQVKKLKILPALEVLVMKGTPYMGGTGDEDAAAEEEDPEVRIEVTAALPKIKRINKSLVTDEERAEAKELMMQWIEEGDHDEEEEEQVEEEHTEEQEKED